MTGIDANVIEELKKISLISYLETCDPTNLVRVGVNVYSTKEHDSLRISNGKWMWWSRRIGGATALDYLIKVKDMSFLEAEVIVFFIAFRLYQALGDSSTISGYGWTVVGDILYELTKMILYQLVLCGMIKGADRITERVIA